MLKLRILPDDILHKKAEEIAEVGSDTKRIANEMIDVMHSARGIGLAGPQVGLLDRIFVTHVERDKPRVFINPQIVETSIEESEIEEGCLSIPGIYAPVTRSSAIRVQAINERGRPFAMDADGMLARVILHELDHLNGVLFLDHLAQSMRDEVMTDYKPERPGRN